MMLTDFASIAAITAPVDSNRLFFFEVRLGKATHFPLEHCSMSSFHFFLKATIHFSWGVGTGYLSYRVLLAAKRLDPIGSVSTGSLKLKIMKRINDTPALGNK